MSEKHIDTYSYIVEYTEDPANHWYSDLLWHPQLIHSAPHPLINLLVLFADGSWPHYMAHQADYHPLSPKQQIQLKRLTILDLLRHKKHISMSEIESALQMSCLEVQRLLMEMSSLGMVEIKMDEVRKSVRVWWAQLRKRKHKQEEIVWAEEEIKDMVKRNKEIKGEQY